ncbi:UDP-N-acetylmuramoyl-tripeptide--D-alanyl-D-alanine ligase [Nocardia sp. CDC159]|uniref:UDP-N-acetylmuramoyl-tripeptide--D-alanyl-D-alanine ligase n=1 Tax=Nocardia pulmonis TaxID=2951408 RepID=A0A9X2E305_9NOCA|nr:MULTISPECIES: UDP-N-acetylmuramoyl-tripeptide--D-alanyl-D-alanine ligase [Nocardia]MCM6773337.1 UDP-N-acetylmuramoyl-tripeptide--D-alanyl-D-alanine ligase [Nocardia pulmonis]MCM6786224.1 UDP-N-acetylmuramoyl-tripeptide--D-alanyl-D-alanine ligase [Nocardia sp. CDC159]
MIEMTLREIADVVGGTLHDVPDPAVTVTGAVEFDSRRIEPGGLFLALPGERVDGHDFAAAAVAAGAVAVLAARPVGVPAIVVEPLPGEKRAGESRDARAGESRDARAGESRDARAGESRGARAGESKDAPTGTAYALAHDADGSGAAVLAALGRLARVVVDRLVAENGLTVVGITGSSGKTSTKDLLAGVLAPLGSVVAPPGSFNNEIGHPWTALRATTETKFLVLELSARGHGHIKALTEIAPPRIGVVLNVGTAHLGEFGSREAIAQAKGELVEALPADGVAVLNADDSNVVAMAARTAARVVRVGQAESAEVRATDVVLDEAARARFTLSAKGSSVEVRLAVHGEHQVGNALSAAAVALECGADLDTVARALSGATVASAHRMDVRTRADGVTVINDSYNANPDSMRAALKALVTMSKAGERPRRSWAVLGEMAELGEESVVEHDRIGRLAVRLDVDRLVVVGTGRPSRGMHQGAVQEGSWGEESVLVPDIESAIALLDDELAAGDVVLVKASNSVGLWAVAQHLTETEAAR